MRLSFTRARHQGWGFVELYWLTGWVVVGLAWVWDFSRHPLSYCALRLLIGHPCPACGMTRAFVAVLHGQLLTGFLISPLGALACLGLVAFLFYVPFVHWRGFRPHLELSLREQWVWRIGIILLILANWAYLVAAGR